LGGWALPVLRREGKDREALDADVACGAYRLAQRLDAAPVPLDARQGARRRPAAIAVHYDRDMARYAGIAPRDVRRLRLRHRQDGLLAPHHTVMISFSLAASATSTS